MGLVLPKGFEPGAWVRSYLDREHALARKARKGEGAEVREDPGIMGQGGRVREASSI